MTAEEADEADDTADTTEDLTEESDDVALADAIDAIDAPGAISDQKETALAEAGDEDVSEGGEASAVVAPREGEIPAPIPPKDIAFSARPRGRILRAPALTSEPVEDWPEKTDLNSDAFRRLRRLHLGDAGTTPAEPIAEAIEEDEDEGLFDLAASGIDEAALRDMVAAIIREELQGTLGERITRNVRKLVRREIHRVLTSREFE
jgi:hypothetical protein